MPDFLEESLSPAAFVFDVAEGPVTVLARPNQYLGKLVVTLWTGQIEPRWRFAVVAMPISVTRRLRSSILRFRPGLRGTRSHFDHVEPTGAPEDVVER